MSAFSRFESAWPVKSGVLVVGGQACFIAGRCGIMDGGLYLRSVDPLTGKVLETRNYNDTRPVDLLVSDGRTVFFAASRESPDTGTYTPTTSAPKTPLLTRLSAGATYHGPLAILNMLDSLDQGQTAGRKRALTVGNKKDGDLIAFDKDRTVTAWRNRAFWGIDLKGIKPGEGGQEQVICRGTANWINKETGQQKLALLLAGTRVYCAGIPANHDSKEPPLLWVLSAADGSVLQKLPLDAAPSIDGLSAVAGRLLLTTTDGHVICFGAQ